MTSQLSWVDTQVNWSKSSKMMEFSKLFKLGFHPFHLVDKSPWPFLMSVSLMEVAINLIGVMASVSMYSHLVMSVVSCVLVTYQWWRDVIRESTFQGNHTSEVQSGLVLGVLMFISSEVMFFFSFFFGFFSSMLSPDVAIGCSWPPLGIQPLSFMMIPLLNTLLLLSSGVTITWSHHSLVGSSLTQSIWGLSLTLMLGVVFVGLQYIEYEESSFTMADSVFGSFFFMMTGFHGLHVIIGLMMIGVMTVRMLSLHFSPSHHLGFESAAWYWHFVDVVWMLLFISVYWLGS
uniref:Cytochrome c oxidase subunit 3 n=1 Tax=Goniodes dissimilis TaxID=186210 RepID=A0A9E9ETM7_9NEOP|nr:cytochrome c oxidase subunit III [Goniodes dissimilis]